MTGPVLRYPGAKWRIAEWVCGHMPEHGTYIEPFFGSGAVFFTKEPSAIQIINDLDGDVINLFQVIRDQPQELAELIELTPWSRDEYGICSKGIRNPETSALERARQLIVLGWQSFGGKKITTPTSWRLREGSGQNPLSAWNKVPDRIRQVAERLKGAQIENRPAVKIITRFNNPEVLIYADPPYLGESRTLNLYRHEMHKAEEHLELLDALLSHLGPVLLSGYPSDLYDIQLKTWKRVETSAVAQSGAQRTEVLWLNPVAWRRLKQAQPTLLEVL